MSGPERIWLGYIEGADETLWFADPLDADEYDDDKPKSLTEYVRAKSYDRLVEALRELPCYLEVRRVRCGDSSVPDLCCPRCAALAEVKK